MSCPITKILATHSALRCRDLGGVEQHDNVQGDVLLANEHSYDPLQLRPHVQQDNLVLLPVDGKLVLMSGEALSVQAYKGELELTAPGALIRSAV